MTEHATKLNGSLIQRLPGVSGPEFKLIAMTMTLMATVAADCYVHGEAPMTPGRAIVQRATPVPLNAPSTGRLELDHAEHLLHRDLGAKLVEVDSWHGFFSFHGEGGMTVKEGSFRSLSLYGERGTILFEVSRHVANQPSCGGSDRLAPETPEPRPAAGS